MEIILIPFERVIEVNTCILQTEPGHKGPVDTGKLQGALGRIETAIHYNGLDDVFEIAGLYAEVIANSHALPDANKRTSLAIALEYLSLHDFEINQDNDLLADAIRDLVLGELSAKDIADLLYSQYDSEQERH
ncbi:type II toxin-antitoxin system death-on-curing family toxin [Oceanobacter sp. 3_MG-2023]|uniref:type II toxin-antitoxin system death-on-curing family toxin n=1 Tax=Oceanobacter sp. 3_MG-2023 TaxID=3062622 RepID=UPI0027353A88|nr:type II toxin-antitoxin system death-on-curing family toxin [Oceanobacter sp. 3_MG-2023]MDP2504938.1 type II toxin-antitoxin system death-on-curing family toxin [Oceanobacter sp. 3_MG-2023]